MRAYVFIYILKLNQFNDITISYRRSFIETQFIDDPFLKKKSLLSPLLKYKNLFKTNREFNTKEKTQ